MTEPTDWRKSSRSDTETSCVEVGNTLDRIRDTKNRTGPTLAIPTGAFRTFVDAATSGTLDTPNS